MTEDTFKPYVKGVYHGLRLCSVPNNAGLNLMTYKNITRQPHTYAEQLVVSTTDKIIARLMAV